MNNGLKIVNLFKFMVMVIHDFKESGFHLFWFCLQILSFCKTFSEKNFLKIYNLIIKVYNVCNIFRINLNYNLSFFYHEFIKIMKHQTSGLEILIKNKNCLNLPQDSVFQPFFDKTFHLDKPVSINDLKPHEPLYLVQSGPCTSNCHTPLSCFKMSVSYLKDTTSSKCKFFEYLAFSVSIKICAL